MNEIFISYRREDSGAASGRIYDRLCEAFSKDKVFKDVDNIPPGIDFHDFIADQLANCRVELVVIGPSWLTPNKDGIRRLDKRDDFVRIEIEVGLNPGKTVIPILVDYASMPDEGQLPASIRKLARREGRPVRNDPDFNNDIQRLIRGLARELNVLLPATIRQTPPLNDLIEGASGSHPLSSAATAALDPVSADALALERQLDKLLQSINLAADGDLQVHAEVTSDMVGVVANSFNFIVEELVKVVSRVRQVIRGATNAAQRLQGISSDVDRRAKMVEDIAKATNAGTQTPDEVASAMSRIAVIMRETNFATQNANNDISYLADLLELLRDAVAKYRLPDHLE
jgi:hypothetical protein